MPSGDEAIVSAVTLSFYDRNSTQLRGTVRRDAAIDCWPRNRISGRTVLHRAQSNVVDLSTSPVRRPASSGSRASYGAVAQRVLGVFQYRIVRGIFTLHADGISTAPGPVPLSRGKVERGTSCERDALGGPTFG